MSDFDLSVYLVTEPGSGDVARLAALVAEAVDGGATLVQLRDKAAPTRQLVTAAAALRGVLRARGVPLIVNDRVDVALAVGADGVHLGQEDMPAPIARELLGHEAIIGLSIDAAEEIDPAALAVVDYVGIGHVWPTTSKDKAAPPIGPAGLAALRRLVALPVVAIGGVTAARAGDAIAAGADGVAVVSAIMAAADPRDAAAHLSGAVAAARAATAARTAV